jgi:hypothetical protein
VARPQPAGPVPYRLKQGQLRPAVGAERSGICCLRYGYLSQLAAIGDDTLHTHNINVVHHAAVLVIAARTHSIAGVVCRLPPHRVVVACPVTFCAVIHFFSFYVLNERHKGKQIFFNSPNFFATIFLVYFKFNGYHCKNKNHFT